MPLRDESSYNIVVDGEPQAVTDVRKKILSAFDDLEFVEEGHKYHIGDMDVESVSSFAHRFDIPFDSMAQAVKYAESHGGTAEYWLDQWDYKAKKATTTGTLVHSYAESMTWIKAGHPENITPDNLCKWFPEKGWLIPTRGKEESVLKFWSEISSDFHIVLPETRVYNIGNTERYAGTFDLLMWYEHPEDSSKSGLVVLDWKTNADLYKEFNRRNARMMLHPFECLYSEPFGAYTIQLNLYSMALRKIGLKVVGKRVIWLKEDGSYEIVKVGDVTKQLLSVDPGFLPSIAN